MMKKFFSISLFACLFIFANQALADCSWETLTTSYTPAIPGSAPSISTSGGCAPKNLKEVTDKSCVATIKPNFSANSGKTAVCCCSDLSANQATPPIFKIPNFQVKIPGMADLSKPTCLENGDGTYQCEIPWLGEYIKGIYNYAFAIAGILAALILMAGGLIWLISGGDASRITQAKELIIGSVTGTIILATSYLILVQVNSDLVNLQPISIGTISRIMIGNEAPEGATTDLFKCLYEKYGNSASEVQKKLTTVNFLGKDYRVNSSMAVALNTAQGQITAAGITYQSTDPSGGAFNWRENKNKPTEQSLHSFGIAFDINPSRNPNYESKERPCKTDIPQNLITILKNNGFRWGGEYKTVCDSMHFEWVKGNALCTVN
jgi:hypothetical protein